MSPIDFAQKSSNTPIYMAHSENDAAWMEGESIRSFITTQGSLHLLATLIVVPIVIFILYPYVYKPTLLIWFSAISFFTAYRWLFLRKYQQEFALADTQAQLRFNAKYSWTWPFTALLWGSLVWIFFGKAPLFNQLVCWVILAGIGGFATTGYAAHVLTMRKFINTLLVVLLSGMLWRYAINSKAAIDSLIYSILPLQIVFWVLLRVIGSRFNVAHIERLHLIKGNQDLISSLQDQTHRANQAVETKNRFLASAAHDIRQPVLVLDLYASMLRSEPEMAVELTEKINVATTAVIAMFDSLFDLSRLDSGQLHINNGDVDVKKLMRDLELQYKPAADAKKLQLRVRVSDCSIYTDEQLLKRILGNLLMNAIKFTEAGGILLACRDMPDGVRFEVWDTGIGIPESQQMAVLKEFYKSPTHPGTSEGFGLGLNIVTRLCEPLGFRFSMKSQVGRGSVFQVYAPRTPPKVATVATNPADAHKK